MTPKKTRLTKPQERYLRNLADNPSRPCWYEYPPLVKLVELGLVTTKQGTMQCTATLTDAGREWLEAHKGD